MDNFFKGITGGHLATPETEEERLRRKQLRKQQEAKRDVQKKFEKRDMSKDPRWMKIMRNIMKPGTDY